MRRFVVTGLLIVLSGCTIQGGIGYQPPHPRPTHEYGSHIGEIRIEAESRGLYTACHHVSGLGTAENDGGLNYCAAGLRVEF